MALPVVLDEFSEPILSSSITDVTVIVPSDTKLIVVWVSYAFGSFTGIPTVSMVTGPTLPLINYGGTPGLRTLGAWAFVNPPISTITIRVSSAATFTGAVIVRCFGNVDATVPYLVGAFVIGTATSSSLSMGNPANSLTVDALASAAVPIVGAGQTELLAQGTTPPHALYGSSEPGPSPAMSWTWAGFQVFCHGVIAVRGPTDIIVSPDSAVAMSIVPLPTLTTVIRLDVDVAIVLTPDQDKEVHLQV